MKINLNINFSVKYTAPFNSFSLKYANQIGTMLREKKTHRNVTSHL